MMNPLTTKRWRVDMRIEGLVSAIPFQPGKTEEPTEFQHRKIEYVKARTKRGARQEAERRARQVYETIREIKYFNTCICQDQEPLKPRSYSPA